MNWLGFGALVGVCLLAVWVARITWILETLYARGRRLDDPDEDALAKRGRR